MRGQFFEPLTFVSFGAMALAFPDISAADVFNIDEFAVTNNGTQIFDDSFNRTPDSHWGIGDQLVVGNDLRRWHDGELLC